MLGPLAQVMRRDLSLAWRRRSEVATSLSFFVLVTSLFPLAIGPEATLLRTIAPGVVWVAALLAATLSLSHLFAQDHADGVLDQMLLSPEPLALLVLGKIAAHWLVSALPLLLITPLLALQFGLPARAIGVLLLSLLLGTPSLSLLGAIGAALTLGLRGGGVLLALLVLPLSVPVLLFGTGAVAADAAGMGTDAHFLLLGAMLAATLALAPWVVAAALRIAAE